MYGVSVGSIGKCVGVWGRRGQRYGGVEEGKGKCGDVKKCGGMCVRV